MLFGFEMQLCKHEGPAYVMNRDVSKWIPQGLLW